MKSYVLFVCELMTVTTRRLLYVTLFLMFAMEAFYDPARRALTPTIVPSGELHLATSMDVRFSI